MKRRRVLLTIAGLGSVVALLGLAGLIAPFTDRATTGTNSIESGERAKEVDLQLASADLSTAPTSCGPFTDDLATGLISVSNVQPSSGSGVTGVCVKNGGSSTTSVAFTALDLADVDTACTGDEAAVDPSCGNGGAGELSPQLFVGFNPIECETGLPMGIVAQNRLDVLATTSSPLTSGFTGSLAPGQVACFESRWSYVPTTADAPTVAQTDQSTWRFAFDGAQAAAP
jgi:hypothetical protein